MKKVSDFRSNDDLLTIPSYNPGWYRWYATREDLDFLLERLGTDFDSVKDFLLEQDGLYAIYVGITNQSLCDRLESHIRGLHTFKKIETNQLSIFRRSIASIVASDQSAQAATDEFINRLSIEYFEAANASKADLRKIEEAEMAGHLFILNYQKNKHPAAKDIKKKLTEMRKKGEAAALAKLKKEE